MKLFKRIKNDGINLSMEFTVSKNDPGVFSYAFKILYIIFGLVTSIKCITKPLSLETDQLDILFFGGLVIVIGMLLKLIPRKWIRIVIGSILMIIYVWLQEVQTIITGFSELIYRMDFLGFGKYEYIDSSYTGFAGDMEAISLFMRFLIIVVACILYLSVMNRANMGMLIVVTFPLYVLGFILNREAGFTLLEMIAFYMIGYIVFKADSKVYYKGKKKVGVYEKNATSRISGEIIALVSAVFVVLYLFISIIFPQSNYKGNNIINEIKNEVVDYVKETVDEVVDLIEGEEDETKAISGFCDGELGNFDSVNLSLETQLTVNIDGGYHGALYLKGLTEGEYVSGKDSESGRSEWKEGGLIGIKMLMSLYGVDVYDKLGTIPYNALLNEKIQNMEKINLGTLTIENHDKTEQTYFQPSYIKIDAPLDYTLNIYDEAEELNINNYAMYYAMYEEGSYSMEELQKIGEAYLETEEGSGYKRMMEYYNKYAAKEYSDYLESVGEMIQTDIVLPDDLTLDQCLLYVKEYLSNYPYTLSPGKTEDGVDFVEYFLFENKKGYCEHFASAAVHMIRAMGYPARYVSGYMIDTGKIGITDDEESYEIKINGGAAHAWVEVYVENFGWVVFEPTPSAAESEYDGGINGIEGTDNELINPDEKWLEDFINGIIDNKPEDIPQGDDLPNNDQDDNQGDNKEDTPNKPEVDKPSADKEEIKEPIELPEPAVMFCYGLIALGVLALLSLVALEIRRRLIHKKLTKLMESDDVSELYKVFTRITMSTLSATKAKLIHYETREKNAEILYYRMFAWINERRKVRVETSVTQEEYKYILDVLDEGIYNDTLPEEERIRTALEFVFATNDMLYNQTGIISEFFVKYIKCLYLKIK